ncbi:MAG TPA: PAS domain S-box protein [Gaiellaceae bacterium]|nr:PAS domain S-box protein [Gaiellaceae bacterium]
MTASECRKVILDTALDAVVTSDAEGRIVEYNAAAERLFGWSSTDALGQPLDTILVPPALRGRDERFHTLLALPDGETTPAPVELTLSHRSGAPLPVVATAARTTIDGDPILVSFFHDLTPEREAEARFRTLVETLPLAVYRESVEDDFATTYASPQVEAIAGFPPERWTDNPYFYDSLIAIDDLPRVLSALAATREEGVPFHEEFRLRTADGRTIWVEDHAVMVKDERGAILHGYILDVTARKEAELSHSESELRYKLLVEQLPMAIYLEDFDTDEPPLYISPRIESMLGYPVAEWLEDGNLFDRLLHPDDSERVHESILTAHTTGVLREEHRLVHRDGHTIWVEHGAIKFGQAPHELVQGYLLDITDRKIVAAQHAETEAKYRSLVEQLPLVTYTNAYQESVETVYMSPQVEEVLGYRPDEWCGNPGFFESILHPGDRDDVLARVREAHVSGERFSGDYRLIARDGRTVWIRDESQPVAGPDGTFLFIQGFFIDITERKGLELAVAERTFDLEHAVARLKVSEEETIVRLSGAAELHDEITGFHIERMGAYCGLLARLAGIDDERAELIRLASTLHDIGKIAIPTSILLKPGPLTGEERRVIDEHTLIGHRMLAGSTSPLLELAATVALTHHERVDGTGGPHGLAGDAIPIEGRIAAVADVFDALLSDRPYRRALPMDQVIAELRQSAGSHLDRHLVDLFLGSIDEVTRVRAEVEGRSRRRPSAFSSTSRGPERRSE